MTFYCCHLGFLAFSFIPSNKGIHLMVEPGVPLPEADFSTFYMELMFTHTLRYEWIFYLVLTASPLRSHYILTTSSLRPSERDGCQKILSKFKVLSQGQCD